MARKNSMHGLSYTQFYRIWNHMVDRTTNPNNDNYYLYGGRGIKICDSWRKFENFKNDMYESYLIHVNEYGEKDTSIDRINVNDGYYKENCRWATKKQQSNNTRRTLFVSFNETKYPITELYNVLSDDTLTRDCVFRRITRYNFNPIKALFEPLNMKSTHNFITKIGEKSRLEQLESIKTRKITKPINIFDDERKHQIYNDLLQELKHVKYSSTI